MQRKCLYSTYYRCLQSQYDISLQQVFYREIVIFPSVQSGFSKDTAQLLPFCYEVELFCKLAQGKNPLALQGIFTSADAGQLPGRCLVESSSAFLPVLSSVILADLAIARSNVSCIFAIASVAVPFNPPLAAQSKFQTPERLSS